MPTDLYAVLGVQRTASADEIRRAYRRRARQTHPDVNPGPGGAAAFQAVTCAYETLRDPRLRAAYDQILGGAPGRVESALSAELQRAARDFRARCAAARTGAPDREDAHGVGGWRVTLRVK